MQIFSTSLSFGKLEKKMNPNAAIVIFTKYLTSWDFNSLGKRLKVRQFFSIWLRHQTYCLSVTTVQLHEIQYTKVQGVPSISAKTKKKMVRGPYKRDQRVVQDEDLLLKLRNYTGRVEEFQYQRGEDQEQLLEKFKKGEN